MATKAVIITGIENKWKYSVVNNDGYLLSPGVGNLLNSYYRHKNYAETITAHSEYVSLRTNSEKSIIKNKEGSKVFNTYEEILEHVLSNIKEVNYIYVYKDIKNEGSITGYEWKYFTDEDNFEKENGIDYVFGSGVQDRDKIDVHTYCSYDTAAKWGGTQMILLNNIVDIDEGFNDKLYEYYDDYDDDYNIPEIYQYYLTNLTDSGVEWQQQRFPDLIYVYSELLDKWVLCVDHYGTSWDYVRTEYIGHLYINSEKDYIYREEQEKLFKNSEQ